MDQLAGGAVRRQIVEELSLGGYYNVVSGVLDAGDFGTPQRRPRLVFVGIQKELGEPSLPVGSGITKALRTGRGPDGQPALLGCDSRDLLERMRNPKDASIVTVSQALSDLRGPGDAYSTSPNSAFQRLMRRGSAAPQEHSPSRIRDDTRRRLAAIPPGGNVYDLPEELLVRYLGDAKWGPKGNGKTLSRRHFYAYRRLHPDWLAWTANTKADFAYHYADPRGLSAREAARVQGFPDRFHFVTSAPGTPGQLRYGKRHSLYGQIGNAVPPPLAAAIGRDIAGSLIPGAVEDRQLELIPAAAA